MRALRLRCPVNRPLLSRSGDGSALIIVLAFVVLLTALIVAFLANSAISRQVFNARAGQTQVSVLSDSVVQYMKADFRQEIISGSIPGSTYVTANSSGTPVPVYVPNTNANIVPSRTGFVPGATATADPYANIVKVSRYQTSFFSGAGFTNTVTYPSPNYASPVSTATPSLNNRFIDDASTGWTTNGWDKPRLIDTTTYPDALTKAPMPDWVYVTSSGRKALTAPEADVVGRYAYVVYDEGGLLDINSAGCHSALVSADAYDVARKGALGFADLTQIPGINATIRDAIVAWRNHATSSSTSFTSSTTMFATNAPSYLQYLVDGSMNNGFLKVYPGDQQFLSRQDLLAYQATGSSGLTAQSLAYLGTFSRTLNAPTWTPIDSPNETFTPTTTYAANAEYLSWPSSLVGSYVAPVYNRDVINVRWSGDVTFTRPKLDDDTGTQTETVTFHKGDPVLQHRFPLSKIQLLGKIIANPTGCGVVAPGQKPAVGTVAWAVLYYFGLVYLPNGNTSLPSTHAGYKEPHWEYMECRKYETGDGSGSAGWKYLCSIGEVANGTAVYDSTYSQGSTFPRREPNFFELLQAGILRGSIGALSVYDIGASIIDQAMPTDIPTMIAFEPGEAPRQFIGRKSLPYCSQLLFWPYRPKSYPSRDVLEAYLLPVFWNPFRNGVSASGTVSKLRMYLFFSHLGGVWAEMGPTQPSVKNPATSQDWLITSPNYQAADVPSTLPDPVTPDLAKYIIAFNNSSDFSEPTLLKQSYLPTPVVVPTDVNNSNQPVSALTETPNTRWGFFLGSLEAPDSAIYGRLGQVLPDTTWKDVTTTPATWPPETTITLFSNVANNGGQLNYRLQAQDSNGVWRTYDEVVALVPSSNTLSAKDSAGAKLNVNGAAYNASICFSGISASGAPNDAYDYVGANASAALDPRINVLNVNTVTTAGGRLSPMATFSTSVGGTSISSPPTGATIRPFPNTATTQQAQLISTFTLDYPNKFGAPSTIAPSAYPGQYAENTTGTTYSDNGAGGIVYNGGTAVLAGDGVTRPGDGAYGAYPMALTANGGRADDRAIILNRPFLSVGEMGYTFRGEEWKTLDFSSVYSADSGLLDLFSINDTEGADQRPLISGVVNLNTHNPSVLQAIISGGIINGLDTTGAGITNSDAQTMANAIVSETNGQGTGPRAGPLLNRAQLATRVVPLPDIAAALSTKGYVTKDRREAVVRALAEPADTRTWNLLIDIVAQAGRFPNSAIKDGTVAALSQFDVQGERRLWLHLAIDRYTGQVIDEQLEVVHDN